MRTKMPQQNQASMFQRKRGACGVFHAGTLRAAKDGRGMLGAPPAVGHVNDGHIERAEDTEHSGERLHLRAGGETAQQQVADVDEPEHERSGEASVPGPPDAPGAAAPERPGGEAPRCRRRRPLPRRPAPMRRRSARALDGYGDRRDSRSSQAARPRRTGTQPTPKARGSR